LANDAEFTWRDGARTIHFRAGIVADSPGLLSGSGWESFDLLTTPRAVASAPVDLAEAATCVHYVPQGPVAEIAVPLVDAVREQALVALGGGRVIDTAKAVAAVNGGRVAAIPTTLSGAPMTSFHRLPEGHEAPGLHRPDLVIADPDLMAALPDKPLRATAMNALAHGADSLYTPLAHPVSRMTALRGIELIATALDQPPTKRDGAGLSLGALLCAYAVDSALFALHHVVCQSLVRVLGTPHAETNATMLPRTMRAMRERAPDQVGAVADAVGAKPAGLFRRLESLGGGKRHLEDLGAERARLDEAVDAIMARPELVNMTPSPPERDEITELVEDAW
jgi:alcohol dehydrogenase class IV